MQVLLVHDGRPGCKPGCADWIVAQGKIVPGTAARFNRVLASLGSRKVPVFVDSLGGSVEAATAMGRNLRARHLDVAVATSALAPCLATDPSCFVQGKGKGVPAAVVRDEGAVCASACVLVLAAGEHRYAVPGTLVGVHQIVRHETLVRTRNLFRILTRNEGGRRVEVSRTLISSTPISSRMITAAAGRATYDRVKSYITAMGVSADLMPLMLATPSTGIHWLTPGEQTVTDLVTDARGASSMLATLERPKPEAPQPVTTPAVAVAAAVPRRKPNVAGRALVTGDVQASSPVAGEVIWSVDASTPDTPVLRAAVAVPAINLSLLVTLLHYYHSPDQPSSDLLDIKVAAGPAIASMDMPRTHDFVPPQTFPLYGQLDRLKDGTFETQLARGSPMTTLRNEGTIQARTWLDVVLHTAAGRTLTLSLEHGPDTRAIFERVFAPPPSELPRAQGR